MKKVLSVILALMTLIAATVPAFAAAPDISVVSPQYTYIQTINIGLDIDETTGIATCSASCYATGNYTVEIEYQLQRYKDSKWEPVKTWTASGTLYVRLKQYWAVYSGYTYRAYVTVRIRNASGGLLENAVHTKTYYYPKSENTPKFPS